MAYVRQHPDYPKFRKKMGTMPDFSGSNVVDQEKPSGTMNGVNRSFVLAHRPIVSSDTVHKDGMLMARATTSALTDGDYYMDYANNTIIFSNTQIPQTDSVIIASYRYM